MEHRTTEFKLPTADVNDDTYYSEKHKQLQYIVSAYIKYYYEDLIEENTEDYDELHLKDLTISAGNATSVTLLETYE